MGIFFSTPDQTLVQWLRSRVLKTTLDFAWRRPAETVLIAGALGAYGFYCLDENKQAYFINVARTQFDVFSTALKPYTSPVLKEASKIYSWLSQKFQPVYDASMTFLGEIGGQIKPKIQEAELWARYKFYEVKIDDSTQEPLKIQHINWKGQLVDLNPSALTRLSEKVDVKFCIDMTGLFLQSHFVNKLMPLGRYSYPVSVIFSSYQFGPTSNYIPID